MTAVATAIVGSAVIGGIAANKASKTQAGAAKSANATQLYQFEQTREDQQPYRDAGYAGLNELQRVLGLGFQETPEQIRARLIDTVPRGKLTDKQRTQKLNQLVAQEVKSQAATRKSVGFGSLLRPYNGANLESDPGFKFGLQQGQQAIDRSAASRGGLYSGATLKALNRFGNDYGSTKYNDAFNRNQVNKNQIFNMLSGVSGTGQTATNQVAAAGQNYANQVSQNQIGAGNARASGYVGIANSLTGGVGQMVNYQQNQNLLNSFNDPTRRYTYGNMGSGD